MLEFRIRENGTKVVATIDREGLLFDITQVKRRKKTMFMLVIFVHHSSVFSNVYKTQENAKIKANAWYDDYVKSEEEE